MNELELFLEFKAAFTALELDTKQSLTIDDVTSWGLNWWKERNVSVWESTIMSILNTWRDNVFYTLELYDQIIESFT